MLAARGDLVDKVSEIAGRGGFTLYGIVNDTLELLIKADKMGISLIEVVDKYEILKSARENGFILGMENLWYEMAELAYEKAKVKTLKSWFDAGVWLAKRYMTSEVKDSFASFKRDLEAFTWNASEFSIQKAGEEISVRVISPRFPESYTLLFVSFLEGALETFGYKIVGKEVYRGNIRLEAVREGGNVQGKG
jgi:hypothetical protein